MTPKPKTGRPKPRRPGRPKSGPGDVAVRERLLAAADRLFYAEGIESVGVDRILAEAGAAKASLYDHFRSKEDLVAAYLERRGSQWRLLARQALDQSKQPPVEKLLTLFDLIVEFAASPDFRGCPFQNASCQRGDGDGEVADHTRAQRQWTQGLIHGLLAEAKIPNQKVEDALIVLYEGAMIAAQFEGNSRPAAAARWAAERLLSDRRL